MRSPLSDTYFSASNIEYIQNTISRAVKNSTGHSIGRQSDADLYNLMRKVYTDYMIIDSGKNIPEQVATMNRVVVNTAVKTISNGIIQNLIYLRDISSTPVPPNAPRSTSTHGLKLSRY